MPLIDLTLEITKNCPMRCILCSSDGGEPLSNEFDIDEIKEIVSQAKSIGVNKISLSGGEPLTYPYIFDICKFITSLNINISIYTCGNILTNDNSLSSISEEHFIKLKNVGVKKIVFSIHGSTPIIHNKITRKNESFRNLILSIRNAKKAYLNIETHFVPLRENFREIPNIVALLNKLGLKSIHILRFVPQGRGELHKNALELHPDEVIELRSIINDVSNNSDVKIIVGAHYNCLGLDNNKKCTAGIGKAVIRPDGFVFPCVGMKRVESFIDCNNVKENKLEYIIDKSYGFKLLRNLLVDSEIISCHYCNGEYICTNGCVAQKLIAHNTEIFDKDPHCIQHSEKLGETMPNNNKSLITIDSNEGMLDVRSY